jgi:SAM-dependent methyltransferase
MTTASEIHAQGLLLFAAGRHKDALAGFRSALRESDSSELWNDWAAVQFILGHQDEAEAGFRCALDADGTDTLAALNLAALLLTNNNGDDAAIVLEPRADKFKPAETRTAELVLQKARAISANDTSAAQIKDELQRFVTADPNEQSYFQTHLQRYIETLRVLPRAAPGAKLLELGAAFHHLTPALLTVKGFAEVRCNDIWSGSPQVLRELRSTDGRDSVSAWVDNFDIQQSPWPYQDAAFDAVLFCEMLEHLHSDPMAVFAEINRVLRQDGLLLLTTPNLASCHSVEFALRGESPYVYGKFEPSGGSTDRHNREYTPGEIQRLARAAGFETVRLETRHSWWQPDRQVLRMLASRAEPIARRGDNIFFLARKVATVRDRYPEEFYLLLGTQAERRVAQSGQEKDSTSTPLTAKPVSTLKILVIHELVPHFDQSGSDLRLLDVLKEIRAQGHRVTLLARDGADSERYSPELESLGIRVIAGDPDRQKHLGADENTSWSFDELLRSEQFDAAILCHWFWSGISIPEHYLNEIRRSSPNTRIAILTDDRHGERERRAATLSGRFSDFERANDFETREIAACRAADPFSTLPKRIARIWPNSL